MNNTQLPTVAEAMEFARGLPADCHADRCLLVLRADVERLNDCIDDHKTALASKSVDLSLAEARAERAEAALRTIITLADPERGNSTELAQFALAALDAAKGGAK